MRYLLDTDICSYILRARDLSLLAVVEEKARAGADPHLPLTPRPPPPGR